MSQSQAAAAMDRLPWLADEPEAVQPRRKSSGHPNLLGWTIVAALLVAALSYWLGAGSWHKPAREEVSQPGATIAVPQARTAEAPQPQQPQVTINPAPEVSPVPVREVPIARPHLEKRWVARRSGPQLTRESPSSVEIDKVVEGQKGISETAEPAPSAVKPVARPDDKPLTAWPASISQGAEGRIVRIGAFGTREQAKLGWRHMVRAYPALVHLKATVVSDRNSRGRHFYRFQIGTTSQAHSEVLCQRMDRIRFSCAVVGLSWKPKGVER
ncbi:MAG: hypothetical protein ACJ8F4_03160 [Sphingomonas sp.]